MKEGAVAEHIIGSVGPGIVIAGGELNIPVVDRVNIGIHTPQGFAVPFKNSVLRSAAVLIGLPDDVAGFLKSLPDLLVTGKDSLLLPEIFPGNYGTQPDIADIKSRIVKTRIHGNLKKLNLFRHFFSRRPEKLLKKIVGESLQIERAFQPAKLDESFSLILVFCDYNCNLEKCLKNFLFIYYHRHIPAAILKLAVIQNNPSPGPFLVGFLTNATAENSCRDILMQIKERAASYSSSVRFLLWPYDPLRKIIEVQQLIVESPEKIKKTQ